MSKQERERIIDNYIDALLVALSEQALAKHAGGIEDKLLQLSDPDYRPSMSDAEWVGYFLRNAGGVIMLTISQTEFDEVKQEIFEDPNLDRPYDSLDDEELLADTLSCLADMYCSDEDELIISPDVENKVFNFFVPDGLLMQDIAPVEAVDLFGAYSKLLHYVCTIESLAKCKYLGEGEL